MAFQKSLVLAVSAHTASFNLPSNPSSLLSSPILVSPLSFNNIILYFPFPERGLTYCLWSLIRYLTSVASWTEAHILSLKMNIHMKEKTYNICLLSLSYFTHNDSIFMQFHCVNVLHFHDLVISRYTSRLSQNSGSYD